MKTLKTATVSLASVFFMAFPSGTTAETWNLTALEWPPFAGSEMSDGGSTTIGIRDALAKKGIEVTVTYLPWKRAIESVKQGKFDAAFPAWPEEVTEGLVGSEAVNHSRIAVIHRVGEEINFTTVDDLFKNYRVGYVSTYVYPNNIQDAITKYPTQAEKSPDETSLMKKLQRKRMDVVLSDPDIMQYISEREGIDGLVAHKRILEKKDLVVMFRDSDKGHAMLRVFNEALE